MSVRLQYHLGFALILLAAGQSGLRADDPPKGRPTPIIFSAPRSDAVSSNLNQIGTKSSPLKDLESGLKKPFEIFDTGRSGEVLPANRFVAPTPSTPVLNNRNLKDFLDKRAEESYLLAEEGDSALSREDSLRVDTDPFDPADRKSKTSLDRYYDRIDRTRGGPTNQTSRGLDLFGDRETDVEDDAKVRKSGGLFDKELSANARVLGQMSNNISEGGRLSSEKMKSRSFGDSFELGPVESARPVSGKKDSRLDEFKRLLDGPGYGARTEFNVAPPAYSPANPTAKPIVVAPSPILSGSPQTAGGFAKVPGYSGTVGTPVGVPDYAASSPSLTPALQETVTPKPPVPTFSIPRRRF